MEAFGSEEWREMSAETVLERLTKATRAKAGAGGTGRTLRYAELFKDGVFDVTFGMGYKEGEDDEKEFGAKSQTAVLEAQLLEQLAKRGFKEDPKLAWKLLAKAGRGVADRVRALVRQGERHDLLAARGHVAQDPRRHPRAAQHEARRGRQGAGGVHGEPGAAATPPSTPATAATARDRTSTATSSSSASTRRRATRSPSR